MMMVVKCLWFGVEHPGARLDMNCIVHQLAIERLMKLQQRI